MRETGGLQSPWSSELFQADLDLRPGSTVSSWASPSTPLDLRFLLCKVGVGPCTQKGYCKVKEIMPASTQANADTARLFSSPPALPTIYSQRHLEPRHHGTLSLQRAPASQGSQLAHTHTPPATSSLGAQGRSLSLLHGPRKSARAGPVHSMPLRAVGDPLRTAANRTAVVKLSAFRPQGWSWADRSTAAVRARARIRQGAAPSV